MSLADDVKAPIRHADRFFIGGQWVQPSSDATIKVVDSGTEELFFSVAEAQTQMGPLVASRQRDRVEGYIAKGVADGFTLATGGGRPKDLDRGWFDEPTVFGNVDNSSVIAQEEIFGPVLSVIPAADEQDAVRIANDTIYGLNASVFTHDVDRARAVAGQLRSGTVGHNAFRTDFSVSFGGFKQSGIGREGIHEGLPHFLETKFVILEGRPAGYENTEL